MSRQAAKLIRRLSQCRLLFSTVVFFTSLCLARALGANSPLSSPSSPAKPGTWHSALSVLAYDSHRTERGGRSFACRPDAFTAEVPFGMPADRDHDDAMSGAGSSSSPRVDQRGSQLTVALPGGLVYRPRHRAENRCHRLGDANFMSFCLLRPAAVSAACRGWIAFASSRSPGIQRSWALTMMPLEADSGGDRPRCRCADQPRGQAPGRRSGAI